jgi:hypothetical protein
MLLQAVQRQGHASRLLQQLESVLQEAGLQQLAVVLEPDVSMLAAACDECVVLFSSCAGCCLMVSSKPCNIGACANSAF